MTACTKIVENDKSMKGLAACHASRPPHSEGLAVFTAADLANEAALPNGNLQHLSSKKALQAALMMSEVFPHIDFRREVTIGHLMLDADIALVDPAQTWTIRAAESPSTQGYTPFEGPELSARVDSTFFRGALVYDGGQLVGKPRGQYLHRPTA
jgi:dihydroorotase-like cyclic amidohydrolase